MDSRTTQLSNHSTEEVFYILWDYYKDVHGYRPRHMLSCQDNREFLINEIESLDHHMELMRSTPEGRNQLRWEGWVIRENEVEDGWDQEEYEHRWDDDYIPKRVLLQRAEEKANSLANMFLDIEWGVKHFKKSFHLPQMETIFV